MRMRSEYQGDWHDVCGNCQFFDGTQDHPCQLNAHARLNGEDCPYFLYDTKHNGSKYGCDVLTEDRIKAMTYGFSKDISVGMSGDDLGFHCFFDVTLSEGGSVSIWADSEYGIKLDKNTMLVLKKMLDEGLRRMA